MFLGSGFAKETFVTTIHPLAAIVSEITANKAEVVVLVPPGATPHSYSLKPSDAMKSARAAGLFYVSDNLDGWVANIQTKNKINILDMIPEESLLDFSGQHKHEHNDGEVADEVDNNIDPHFWTDPIIVKELVPIIADTLGKLDPENAAFYKNRANLFVGKLELLHKRIEYILQEKKNQAIYQFHPSFNYFINRYKLLSGGVIEDKPGDSESAEHITEIIKSIRNSGVKSIFKEVQFSSKTVEMISKEAKVNIYELDPIGGVPGRLKYNEIMLYNANTIKKAL